MNRLWSIESAFSNTGAMADHRLPLRAELGLPFAMALDAALGGGAAPNSEFLKEKKVPSSSACSPTSSSRTPASAVVIAGRRQPPEVHALVAQINQTLGAVGTTLDYHERSGRRSPDRTSTSITALAKDMARRQACRRSSSSAATRSTTRRRISTSPARSPRSATSMHLREYDERDLAEDVVARAARALPRGVGRRPHLGRHAVTIAQPLIAPLYGGLSIGRAAVAAARRGRSRRRTLVQAAPRASAIRRELEAERPRRLRAGHHAADRAGSARPAARPPQLTAEPARQAPCAGEGRARGRVPLLAVLRYDGRFANNAWLQETPDFLTKVTWDNYALVGPETAKELGVDERHDRSRSRSATSRSSCPATRSRARRAYSIGLVLGGGRTARRSRAAAQNGSTASGSTRTRSRTDRRVRHRAQARRSPRPARLRAREHAGALGHPHRRSSRRSTRTGIAEAAPRARSRRSTRADLRRQGLERRGGVGLLG